MLHHRFGGFPIDTVCTVQIYLPTDLKRSKCLHLFTRTHRRAGERHLPYGITQCYLSSDAGERSPPVTTRLMPGTALDASGHGVSVHSVQDRSFDIKCNSNYGQCNSSIGSIIMACIGSLECQSLCVKPSSKSPFPVDTEAPIYLPQCYLGA